MALMPLVVMNSVVPSGAARAASVPPMLPPAPGRFSTVTVVASDLVSSAAMARDAMSTAPPGGNGQISLIGLGWAMAMPAAHSVVATRARARVRIIGKVSCCRCEFIVGTRRLVSAARGRRRARRPNSAGCSKAAKCPPRGIACQWRIWLNPAASIQRRTGGTISCGYTATPVGTVTGNGLRLPGPKLSQYSRADDAALAVTQYSIRLSSSASRSITFSGSPPLSVQAQNFSRIQAAWPAGESVSA
jgi:hypothetical protein